MTVMTLSWLREDAGSIGGLNCAEKGNGTHNIMERKSAIAGSSVRLLQAFAEAAKSGSFARAARELGLSASAVTKSVQRLEAQVNLRLFQRTTRRVALTQEGEAFYQHCRRVLDDLAELALLAAGTASVPSGVLRINVPVTYGKKVILPTLAQLARRHPDFRFEVQLSDQFVDLIGAGLDAVVRIGEIADRRLVARRVDEQGLGVYASPDYLRRRARPGKPSDISAHDCVVFQMLTTRRLRPWAFQQKGRRITVTPPATRMIDDGEGLVSAACAGLGLVQVPDLMAEDAVRAGLLEEVLRNCRLQPEPISVVFPTQRHMPMRLRVFIDALLERHARPRGPARRSA
jgi:DNA-binding transcriptional LysR family regulator